MAMIQSFPTGSGSGGTSKISQKSGNSLVNITGSTNPNEDGLYSEDLTYKFDRINYAQKIVNKPGREELISASVSLPKFTKPTTGGTSKITSLGVTITLNNDINNYEYIDISLQPSSTSRKRIPQISRIRVDNIVYNNTTSENVVDGSTILIDYNIDTTSGYGGQYHANIKAWFKDSTHLYLFQGSTSVADENWRDWVITNITGVVTESTIVDPVSYLSENGNLEETPVGSVISYMGNNVPKHYLACDGTVYSIADYSELAIHIKNEFGSINYFGGDGTTTFAVPDLSGEFLRGTGTNSHANQGSGANVGEHQDATDMPNYWYDKSNVGMSSNLNDTVTNHVTNVDSTIVPTGTKINFNNNASNIFPSTLDHDWAFKFTTRPTNTSVLYCIKYETTHKIFFGDQTTYKVTVPFNLTTLVHKFARWTLDSANAIDDISLINGNDLVAPMDGYYLISASSGFISDGAQDIEFFQQDWYVNNVQISSNRQYTGSNRDTTSTLGGNVLFRRLNKGDKVQLGIYQGGHSLQISGTVTMSLVNTLNENKVLELMNKPNLWVAGQEYDFGDGIYGQRFTGNVTPAAANKAKEILLTSTIYSNIIESGGMWNRGKGKFSLPIGGISSTTGSIELMSSIYTKNNVGGTTSGLYAAFLDNGVSTTTYDIWVKYTK